ncbi:MAG: melibiose:sodium transporter MelB [Lachnospiraceae bacterium]|nr:melibiose:sodium transporter MelB [Lachnospiraceae bacterium]
MKKPKQRRGSLSVIEKYSYGIGCLGSNMIYGIIATFGMIYLTDEVKLPAGFVGTMFFAAKFWDAVNDFIMGMIVDNTHTRFGKFKPWILAGTLSSSAVLIWFFSPWNVSLETAMLVATIAYVAWGMTFTMFDISYWSMLPNLAQDPKEREQISVIPRIFAIIGSTVIVGGFGIPIIKSLGGGQTGYSRFAWIIAAMFIISSLITVLGIRNQDNRIKTEDTKEKVKKERTTLKDAFRAVIRNDQLIVAIVIILTFNFALSFAQGGLLYFFKYVSGNENLFSYYTLAQGAAVALGLIVYPKLVSTLSRRTVYLWAGIFPAAGMVILFIGSFIVPESAVVAVVSGFVFAIGQGLQLGSVTVFLADTVDYGEYKLGKRNESVTFSCQTLLTKFASALSTMLVGWCLTMTGYVPNSVQSEATLMGIRIVSIVLPAVFALISMVVFLKFMKLDRETVEDILKELKMRQNEKKKEMSRTDKAVV